jgi:site-specific recombinase XerD
MMQKKIFCPKLYPLNEDMGKRWFIRFYVKIGVVSVKKVIIVPKRLASVEARKGWALAVIEKLEKLGYAEKDVSTLTFIPYNKEVRLLVEVLEARTGIKKKTRQQYQSHVKGFNEFCEASDIKRVNAETGEAFLTYLLEGHEGRTVNHYRRTMIVLFSELEKKGKIVKNPFALTTRSKTKKPFSEHFTDKEIALITEGVLNDKPFLFLPMVTILHCATRNGQEMPHIQVQDIDFENNRMWMNDVYAKNGEREAVSIPHALMKIFKERKIEEYPPQYYLFGKLGEPSPTAVGCNFFQFHFRQVLEKCGIYTPKKGFYRLKNSMAVKMVMANFNKFAIQKQFRHKRFDTTEKYLASLDIDNFTELKEFSFF